MKKFGTLIFLLCVFCKIGPVSCYGADVELSKESVQSLLKILDSEILKKEEYDQEKRESIARRMSELNKSDYNEQRYWIARDLYNEYSSYDSDSALYYATMSYNLAKELDKKQWMDEMNINLSYLYSATGLFEEAKACLEKVDPGTLSGNMFINYYEKLLFFHTHKDQFVEITTVENPYTASAENLLKSLSNSLPLTDPDFSWLMGWRSLGSKEESQDAIPVMQKVLKGRKYNSRQDAMDSWMMSRLYEKVGDEDNKLRYLILSAISDVRTSNKEIASLEELANLMYLSGDLDRANSYINLSMECASHYKSRVREANLSRIQQSITLAYQNKNKEQTRNVNLALIALIVVLVFLVGAIIYISRQNKKLHDSRKALDVANSRLNENLEELQNAHVALTEANSRLSGLYSSAKQDTIELSLTNNAMESYIADIFAMCSDYINKMDDFRKKINRMIIAGRLDEVRDITKSTELSTSEIKELYAIFDEIFLKIYPDFVSDFNTLLRPEEQIHLKKGELLNTELRIYALVRLGISDSVKIAKFLHCSVQTVYNTRQRVRNKARIPKEEFASTVKSLGKMSYNL